MFKLADHVKETTLTQGTGTLTLAGSGYSFRDDINSPEGAFVPPYPGEGYILDENTGLWVEASAL